MKGKTTILLLILVTSLSINAAPQGDSFTYQGELTKNNLPVSGNYEFILSFWNASSGGAFLDGQNFDGSIPYDGTGPGITVANGIFTLNVDIGVNQFINQEVWLSLDVSDDGGVSFLELSPRQLITNSPYAIESKYVAENGVDSLAIIDGVIAADDIDSSEIQRRVNGTCSNDESISEIAADGTVTCVAGSGLANGSVSSAHIVDSTIVAADVNSSSVQVRVAGTCAAGNSIRAIASNGTVTCEADDVGTTGWGLTGNVGTIPGTNFIGTTDNKEFDFRVNNDIVMKLIPKVDGLSNPTPNLIFGIDNTIATGYISSNIIGGFQNQINGTSGVGSNIIGATISIVNASGGLILGGDQNRVDGAGGVIIGGYNNFAGGFGSYALGEAAKVRSAAAVGGGDTDGDEGTFVWSSSSADFISTGPKQFLIDASGGVGVGTNAPKAPMHIKGSTDIGANLSSVVMLLEPTTTADPFGDDVNLVISARGSSSSSAIIFAKDQTENFKMSSAYPNATLDTLKFTHTDSLGTTSNFMSLEYDYSLIKKSLSVSADIIPESGGDLGSNTFRWNKLWATNIDSTNAVNVSSDKRLKDNVSNLGYGLADILTLRPVSYNLKKGATDILHLGLIAQEVEKIVPEIVNNSSNEKVMRSIRYGELIPVLIKATQEQQVLIEQLQDQVKELTNNQRINLK